MRQNESDISPTLELLDERACAYQQCLVFLRQAYPNGAVMTYDHTQARGAEHVLLAKFVIGVGESEPRWLTYQECSEETTADNIPGGLRSEVKLPDGTSFQASWYPLHFGRENMLWEGAALLHIHSDAPRKFWLKFGAGNIAFMHFSPNQSMAGEKIDCEHGSAELSGNTVLIRREERPLVTAVKGNFSDLKIMSLEGDFGRYGTYAVANGTGTDLFAVVGFSEQEERAVELAGCDPVKEEERVIRYYDDLLAQWRIHTPDAALNEAFGHALLNVEYAWLRPYGWIESIQHWPTMWHMEHTAAEEWNGRFDRVRECLRSQMQRVFESGAIPDLCPDGSARRDWGGNNQFFFREVEHYIKMTGDLAFAEEAEPFLEKALWQSFAEYDPVGSGVIGWGTQIGNQEDFESTPGKGAATGIEGVRMMEIMSYIKSILGKPEEAEFYSAEAGRCRAEWYRTLWLKDLGRPAWYEDISGELRLETTYHGITYPILYDEIDDPDKVSALDHLLHRMTGPEGEIYQSNHFGDHAYWGVPTWGMQCGSDMQPFASAAYASVGMKKEAVRPLSFIARRVCGSYQRGSWPETANEKRFAYFSPSAAVFSQAVIESIFGLKRDMLENKTVIAPCIPEDWPEASLQLPGVKISYTSKTNGFSMQLQIEDDTRKIIRVLCPPSFRVTAEAEGKKWTLEPELHCGWSSVEFEAGSGRNLTVSCSWEPIQIRCTYEMTAACGDSFSLRIEGDAELIGLEDRCGVFSSLEWQNNKLTGTVRRDLLEKYECYGWFGILNFARRMLFLRLRAGGREFLHPCALVSLPAVYCRAAAAAGQNSVLVEVWNQSEKALTGGWKLLIGRQLLTAEGTVLPKQNGTIVFPIRSGEILFSPGKNKATLQGPIHYPLEIEAAPEHAQVVPIPIPDEACKPSAYWREIGLHPSHGHMMQGPDSFMKGLWEQYGAIPILPSVPLSLNPNGFLPFSKEKHPVVTISLEGRKMKKLYVLFSAFIDNHDVFSRIFRAEAEAVKKDSYFRPVYLYDVYYPGTADMGFGNAVIAGFATYAPDTDRSEVPAMPVAPGETDYRQAQPPAYPQRSLWCKNRAIECCSTVFNLLELDFGEFKEMKELRIIASEADAAGGIFALAAHV